MALVSGFGNLIRSPSEEHTRFAVEHALDRGTWDTPFPALRFMVIATVLNPVERRLQATVAVVPGSPKPVFADGEFQPVVRDDTIRAEFAEAKLTVVLRNGSVGETTVSFPLKHIVLPHSTGEPVSATPSISASPRDCLGA
ncbi:hypothetical protein JNUCC0626_04550 [Lentzea sp. JNUCC 0626]|uniref:hypothetical protein n=1 Tax=Lentzea sp. JNUCC 0626 TaxID=3367513 RepID=UPI003748941F